MTRPDFPHGPALPFAALRFAAHRHSGQVRKSADLTPYINHPIAVADILASEGGITAPEVLAVALLHDTLEDTATTAPELESLFGTSIAAAVVELSDDMTLPKAERKARQIIRTRQCSALARTVRLADKIANVRDVIAHPPALWSLERRLAYLDWASEVIDALRGTHLHLEQRFDESVRQGRQSLTDCEALTLPAPD